jgi:metal-responsive CopG/Arc/MetJ family transcriptional regulator
MRTTDTMTISLPRAMAKQMEKVQKRENRTRSELLREAWRLYYESRYPIYSPTKMEAAAISKGRAEIKRGQFVGLEQLLHEMDVERRKTGPKGTRKVSR